MMAIGFAVSVFVGTLFVFSGTAKLRAGTFRQDLEAYEVLPDRMVGPVARSLPIAEIGLGAAVLGGIVVRAGLAVLTALLLAFAAGMTINLLRRRVIPCGCTGGAAKEISWAFVARNLALAALLISVVATDNTPPGIRTVMTGAERLSAPDARVFLLALLLAAVAGRLALTMRPLWDVDRLNRVPALLGYRDSDWRDT